MKRSHDPVSMRVVTFLGVGAIVGLVVTAGLVFHALEFEGDPAVVALVGSVSSLASLFAGALASILASTGKTSHADATPVEVVNSVAEPVPTAPVAAATSVSPVLSSEFGE